MDKLVIVLTRKQLHDVLSATCAIKMAAEAIMDRKVVAEIIMRNATIIETTLEKAKENVGEDANSSKSMHRIDS